jgi:ribose 5-phosphate isomerase B
MKTLLIASDHAGYKTKIAIQKLLPNFEWEDIGPTNDERVDYPDFAEKLAKKISDKNLGILICGSGIGMSIAANKVSGVRAAVVENPIAAKLAREHNHANILCLGSRFVAPEYAVEIVKAFLDAKPSTDPRHENRIKKITQLEKK